MSLGPGCMFVAVPAVAFAQSNFKHRGRAPTRNPDQVKTSTPTGNRNSGPGRGTVTLSRRPRVRRSCRRTIGPKGLIYPDTELRGDNGRGCLRVTKNKRGQWQRHPADRALAARPAADRDLTTGSSEVHWAMRDSLPRARSPSGGARGSRRLAPRRRRTGSRPAT